MLTPGDVLVTVAILDGTLSRQHISPGTVVKVRAVKPTQSGFAYVQFEGIDGEYIVTENSAAIRTPTIFEAAEGLCHS